MTANSKARRDKIFLDIDQERDRQNRQWGAIPRGLDFHKWNTILVEEVGEVAKALVEKDIIAARAELVQVAAVAAAFLEELDYLTE